MSLLNRSSIASSLALLLSLVVGACGDDDGPPLAVDAGRFADGGDRDDAGRPMDSGQRDAGRPEALPTCAAPEMVTGTIGTVTVTGDTTGGVAGSLDLGDACGNPEAATVPPQFVVAYEVPGDGLVAIEVATNVDGTDEAFDTVLQVRTECEAIPESDFAPTCFDDVGGILQSAGTVAVEGGSVVYIVVTGFGETPVEGASDAGAFTLEITARVQNLPVVTGGEVRIIGERAEIVVEGTDPDMDPLGVLATFLDDTGAPVDLNDDGAADDEDQIAAAFDNLDELEGMASYTGVVSFATLGTRLTELSVTSATVQLVDEPFGLSEEATLEVGVYTEADYGEACSGAMVVCARPLVCTDAVCASSPAVIAACGAATGITVATPTTTATSTMVTGSLEAGAGALEGSCGLTGGSEVVYSVVVPAGSFDLVARTDLPGTGATDTVVYVRSDCEDPTSEVACDDDVGGSFGSLAEVLDAPAGTYAVVVEPFDSVAAAEPFDLEVSLRPVLATGATCDPMGVENRCGGAACVAATMVCP
jgi:hypothetical protein